MGHDWDKAVPSVAIWKECLRVLKPGGFAFIMCIPRQDCLSHMIVNLEQAGFDINFTSIYWAYASGFPKALNISKAIDRSECKKQLTEKLGRKPTKKEFEEEYENYQNIIGEDLNRKGRLINQTENYEAPGGWKTTKRNYMITTPRSEDAIKLDGSYAGFQPKPAVEIIIVSMKPINKSYIDQAKSRINEENQILKEIEQKYNIEFEK